MLNRRPLMLMLAALLLTVAVNPGDTQFPGLSGQAWAKGDSDSGGDDSDDRDDDRDDEKDDEKDDSRDDEKDDDGGGDDGDSGGDDNGGDDSGGDDDNSGPGGGGSDDGSDDDGASGGSGGSSSSSGGSSGSGSDGGGRNLFGKDGIRVTFANGSSERILGNRYERMNARGQVVERRPATPSDKARLATAERQAGRSASVNMVIVVKRRGGALQVIDEAGWVEQVENGRYTLTDPNGNTVTRRRMTDADVSRLRAALGLR